MRPQSHPAATQHPWAQHQAPSSDCQAPHRSCLSLSPLQDPVSGTQEAQNQQGMLGQQQKLTVPLSSCLISLTNPLPPLQLCCLGLLCLSRTQIGFGSSEDTESPLASEEGDET